MDNKLLSAKEAAYMLGVSVSALYVWKCTGRYDLPVIKVGRLNKYRKSDVMAFLERHTQVPSCQD